MSKFKASQLSNYLILRINPSICYRTGNLLLIDIICCKKNIGIYTFGRVSKSKKKMRIIIIILFKASINFLLYGVQTTTINALCVQNLIEMVLIVLIEG